MPAPPGPPLLEVCVDSVDDVVVAQSAGADRIELCAALAEGGLTPSPGIVQEALARATVPLHAMVRPRGGDFLYSAAEFGAMLADVAALAKLGVAGIVFGCLTNDGDVDIERNSALVAAADGASTTFHRAFDMAHDPFEALEAAIACGFDRILTSGQAPTAMDGAMRLRELREAAGERIGVIGCGSVRADSIGSLIRLTGLREFHLGPRRATRSAMQFHNPHVSIGVRGTDFSHPRLDEAALRKAILAVRESARFPVAAGGE